MTAAYPLSWPEGFPRARTREKGQFRTTLAGALENVRSSLMAFGRDSGSPVAGIVLSSNVSLGESRPADPGVAVWFTWDSEQRCIPVDRYDTPAANLQAIHHVLEARRTELRHGTLSLVRATFKGFIPALPAPGRRPWREVLGFNVGGEPITAEMIETAYRGLAKERHPDHGGSDDAMAELTAARAAALKEISR
ncbi:J domain-containing protein [Xanthobacter sp. 126]|uniref:J domain-containing protein n=1 Tax=Xanthobacter sp. 126 TaxID=1131814 RepID=UPI00045EC289|nr:J domain-containing protein [Xanthobacter sp. 126]